MAFDCKFVPPVVRVRTMGPHLGSPSRKSEALTAPKNCKSFQALNPQSEEPLHKKNPFPRKKSKKKSGESAKKGSKDALGLSAFGLIRII